MEDSSSPPPKAAEPHFADPTQAGFYEQVKKFWQQPVTKTGLPEMADKLHSQPVAKTEYKGSLEMAKRFLSASGFFRFHPLAVLYSSPHQQPPIVALITAIGKSLFQACAHLINSSPLLLPFPSPLSGLNTSGYTGKVHWSATQPANSNLPPTSPSTISRMRG